MLKQSLLLIALLSFGNLGAMEAGEAGASKAADTGEFKEPKADDEKLAKKDGGAVDNKKLMVESIQLLKDMATKYEHGVEEADKEISDNEAQNAEDMGDDYQRPTKQQLASEVFAGTGHRVEKLTTRLQAILDVLDEGAYRKRLHDKYCALNNQFTLDQNTEEEFPVARTFESIDAVKAAVAQLAIDLRLLATELETDF